VAELERVNYLAMKQLANVTPGSEVILRDDVLILSNQFFPTPDFNQACLLRATPETVDDLISEVVDYFQSKELTPSIFVSPACTPGDLSQRLLKRGFADVGYSESWMVMENLQAAKAPRIDSSIVMKQIDKSGAPLYARVMAAAYEMPDEWVESLAVALEPSIGAPGIVNYLGFKNDEAVATLTIWRYQDYGILGSAGVLPAHRGTRTLFNLAVQALLEAQSQGIKTIISQTSLGPMFERFMRFYGFKFAFKRTGYMLA
jgi:hypothetical protein